MKALHALALAPLVALGNCKDQEISIGGYSELCFEIVDIQGSFDAKAGKVNLGAFQLRRKNVNDPACQDFTIDHVVYKCGIDFDGDGVIDKELGTQIDRRNNVQPPITTGSIDASVLGDIRRAISGTTKVQIEYEVTVNGDPVPSASNSGYAVYNPK